MTTTRGSIVDAGLPAISYHGALHPEDAHRAIRDARQQSPIALGPYGPEVLSYDLVRSVLRDSRFTMPLGNGLVPLGVTSGPVWERLCQSIVGIDGAEHRRLRRLVARAFTLRSSERMRSACARVISELIDRQTDTGRCDFVADIARHYPIPIICSLLGMRRADWPLFEPWVKDISYAFSAHAATKTGVITQAWENLDAYLDDLIADRRRSLTDDLLSDLIRAEDDGDRLRHTELLILVAVLLVAATDTIRNQLSAAIQVLCEHAEQWTLIEERPELARYAVEEVMRHTPASISTIRVAGEDVELGEVLIPAGTFIVVNTAAANRDRAVYRNPDRLDITRDGPPPMLTFGGGSHHCLGAHLARVELEEALRATVQRMPDLRVTGPAPWKAIIGISGPRALPVEFGHAT